MTSLELERVAEETPIEEVTALYKVFIYIAPWQRLTLIHRHKQQQRQAEIEKLLGTPDKIEWELRNFAPLDDHMTSTRQSIAHLNKELNKVRKKLMKDDLRSLLNNRMLVVVHPRVCSRVQLGQ